MDFPDPQFRCNLCDRDLEVEKLFEHIRHCGRKKDVQLPVLNENGISKEMLEMRAEMKEMKQKMMEMEKARENENMEKVNCRLVDLDEGVKKMSEKNGNVSKMMEENQEKVLKLEGKSEVWFQMLDLHNKNHSEALHKLKMDFKKEMTSIKCENKLEMEKLLSKQFLDSKEDLINERFESLQLQFKNQQTKYFDALKDVSSNVNLLRKKADDVQTITEEMKAEINSARTGITASFREQEEKMAAIVNSLENRLIKAEFSY